MLRRLLLFFMLLLSYQINAQVGVRFAYSYVNAPYWNQLLGENEALYKNGHCFALDYAFPLKNIHATVGPELGYSKFSSELMDFREAPNAFFISQFYHAQLNVRLYLLDIFKPIITNTSKKNAQNTAIDRLFVQFSPGNSMVYHSYRSIEGSQLPERQQSLFLSLGAGFDMLYGNHFKVSPMVIYRYYPSVNWSGLTELRTENSEAFLRDDSFVSQLSIGFRMSWAEQ